MPHLNLFAFLLTEQLQPLFLFALEPGLAVLHEALHRARLLLLAAQLLRVDLWGVYKWPVSA